MCERMETRRGFGEERKLVLLHPAVRQSLGSPGDKRTSGGQQQGDRKRTEGLDEGATCLLHSRPCPLHPPLVQRLRGQEESTRRTRKEEKEDTRSE